MNPIKGALLAMLAVTQMGASCDQIVGMEKPALRQREDNKQLYLNCIGYLWGHLSSTDRDVF